VITTLPRQLTRSLTWDQGHEMAEHARFTVDTGVAVYFCDPKSPWQRGSNENTNGLLRQYLPRHVSMRDYTQDDWRASQIPDSGPYRVRPGMEELNAGTAEEVHP
jgi:IS30 family transposase